MERRRWHIVVKAIVHCMRHYLPGRAIGCCVPPARPPLRRFIEEQIIRWKASGRSVQVEE